MIYMKSLLIKTDVTCIKCCKNYILAGIGGQLHVFKKSKLESAINVFDGTQIFGIVLNDSSTKCLVYGENQLKILDCNFLENSFVENSSYSTGDWILSAKWINLDENIVILTMHNTVLLLSNYLKFIIEKKCKENCILYSGHLVNYTWKGLIVLSGTVFSQILIWWPYKSTNEHICPVLFTLDGHKGVIFSIHYDQAMGLICSTSDDRSARLWSVHNKDLTLELMQPNINIFLKCSMYGHTARVFRCLILDEYILTAGEDSIVNMWDSDGNLIRKFDTHCGAPVWALDYDQDNLMIATAGGDCGVTLLPLNQHIQQEEIPITENENLKKIGLLSNGDFVTISENGIVWLYLSSTKIWRKVKQHIDLISYSLLEIWKSTNSVALAGYHGSLHIYTQDSERLTHMCSYTIPNKSRIFSLHWLSDNNILTCESEGVISICKERWATCACYCSNNHVAVGDRKGNIYLYSLEEIDPIQVIKRAHNHLGATNLYFKDSYLTSLGRNSIIRKYKFNPSKQLLSPVSSDKVPFSWTAEILEEGNFMLLFGFLGNKFIIWDYKNRRILLQFDCGGAHRSWDILMSKDSVLFIFIKKKKVCSIKSDLNLLNTVQIMDGFHFNEINSSVCLQFPNIKKCLLISGGEDTTLRLTKIEYNIPPTFKTENVFKSHLSSIRVITSCNVKTKSDHEQHLIFSAGGRAQIILWDLEIDLNNDDITFFCSEKHSHYETLSPEESETRIMDLSCIIVNSLIVLIAAVSNGNLRVFLVTSDETNNYNMVLIGEVVFKLRCILKVKHTKIHDQDIVLSVCTRGEVTFWNFTNFIGCVSTFKKDEHCILSEHLQNIHAIDNLKLHLGGINSIDLKLIDSNKCLLVTGGDDNAIVITLVKFIGKRDKLLIQLLSTIQNSESHCAQITGVYLTDSYFFTIGIDHKLNVFKWFMQNDIVQIEHIFKYVSSIPDIQGIQCFEQKLCFQTIMYGKGIELCEIFLRE